MATFDRTWMLHTSLRTPQCQKLHGSDLGHDWMHFDTQQHLWGTGQTRNPGQGSIVFFEWYKPPLRNEGLLLNATLRNTPAGGVELEKWHVIMM